jgi:hypothetical protein
VTDTAVVDSKALRVALENDKHIQKIRKVFKRIDCTAYLAGGYVLSKIHDFDAGDIDIFIPLENEMHQVTFELEFLSKVELVLKDTTNYEKVRNAALIEKVNSKLFTSFEFLGSTNYLGTNSQTVSGKVAGVDKEVQVVFYTASASDIDKGLPEFDLVPCEIFYDIKTSAIFGSGLQNQSIDLSRAITRAMNCPELIVDENNNIIITGNIYGSLSRTYRTIKTLYRISKYNKRGIPFIKGSLDSFKEFFNGINKGYFGSPRASVLPSHLPVLPSHLQAETHDLINFKDTLNLIQDSEANPLVTKFGKEAINSVHGFFGFLIEQGCELDLGVLEVAKFRVINNEYDMEWE